MHWQTQTQVKEEIAKCGLSTEVFVQQTEVILKAFDKVTSSLFLAHIIHIILRAFDKVGTIGRAARFCELNLILQNFAEQRDVDLFDIDTPLILTFSKMFPHYWTPGVCEFNVRLPSEGVL